MRFGSETHSNENEDEKEACKRAHAIKSSFNWAAHTATTTFYFRSGGNIEIELIVWHEDRYCDYSDGVWNSF